MRWCVRSESLPSEICLEAAGWVPVTDGGQDLYIYKAFTSDYYRIYPRNSVFNERYLHVFTRGVYAMIVEEERYVYIIYTPEIHPHTEAQYLIVKGSNTHTRRFNTFTSEAPPHKPHRSKPYLLVTLYPLIYNEAYLIIKTCVVS